MEESTFFTIKQHKKGFFNLSSILDDLFKKKILKFINNDKQNSLINDKQNPLIEQINLFMPEDLTKKFDEIIENKKNNPKRKDKDDYYKEFTNNSNTYTLGNEVIRYFNEKGISNFIKEFKQNSKKYTIEKTQLSKFLEKMKTALFSGDNINNEFKINETKIKEILYFDNKENTDSAYSKYISVYDSLLEKKLYQNILVRILISVILLQKPTKDYPHTEYLISYAASELSKKRHKKDEIKESLLKTLDRIWLSFDTNDDNEKELLKNLINGSVDKGEYKFAKILCELNFNELNDDVINKKHEDEDNNKFFESNTDILFSYIQALIKCNEISKAKCILTAKQFEENPDAQFFLYKIYTELNTESYKPEECYKILKKAVNLNHTEASLIYLKELSNNFDQNFDEIRTTLLRLKNKENDLKEPQKKHYYYYWGCYNEKNGLVKEANRCFKEAFRFGNELARTKISKDKREISDFGKCFNTESKEKICIINNNNYHTKALLKTLPEEYCVFSINANFSDTEISGIYEFASLKKCIDELIKEKSLKKAIICLFSDDERENLNQSLEILDRLYNEALNLYNEELHFNKSNKDRIDFINRFDIFIKANYDYASMFIDASISDMGDNIYFKTHIIDKYKNSIQKLLYEKPLFSPMLENTNTTESNTIVISDNINFNISALKEIISIGYMGTKYTINTTVLCNESIKTELNNKLCIEMPGIFKYKLSTELEKLLSLDKSPNKNITLDKKYIIKPNIFSYDNESVPLSFLLNVASHNISEEMLKDLYDSDTITIDEKNIYNILTKSSSSNNKYPFKSIFKTNDDEYYKKLNSANYFIVDVGTDKENIDFALNLRKQFMANSKDMKRKPIIAVYCRDPKTAYLADKITLSNQNQGDYWYNKYDLYFFGMDNTIYSYDAITNNDLENQALHMHKVYCKLENEDFYSDKYHNALNSFYSYQYNVDSSISTAIALKYRLFIANYYKNETNSFFINEKFNPDKFKKEDFAKIEHYRWVNFMLSRGWQAPTFNQLSTYISDDKITNHKYMLLKLHPFIANWDDLDDDGDICKTIASSEKQFISPKESTRNNVKETPNLLLSFKKTENGKNIEKEH